MPNTPPHANIPVRNADIVHVEIFAAIQPFTYLISQSFMVGDSFQPWQPVASGGGAHRHRIGTGAEVRGSLLQVAVQPDGQTELTKHPIRVRVLIENPANVFRTGEEFTIPAGLPTGTTYPIQPQFVDAAS